MRTHSPGDAVTKLGTGIQGFDEITDGGLPRGRTTLRKLGTRRGGQAPRANASS